MRYTILFLIIAVVYFISCTDGHTIGSTELKISFITSQKHNTKDLASEYSINQLEWLILSDSGQIKNWEICGYIIPYIDLRKNYLIMSKYKILNLYQKSGCDECLGVPVGEAIFDKGNSDSNYYYFYRMPKIMLSQGVG